MNTYYLYLIGQANSLVINQMLKFALYMYILDNTGSSVIYSNIIAFSMLPIIFFSPIAGWICDYVKKKKLIVMLDFTSGIILSLFFLLSNKVIAICIILFILGILGTLETPATQAAVPLITDDLNKTNTEIAQISSISAILAPILGGVIYNTFSINKIIIFSIIGFGITAFLESLIKMKNEQCIRDSAILGIKQGIKYLFVEEKEILKLHNIPEGMAVGVMYAGFLAENAQITATSALALSLGIAIQNFPEGAIISMPLRAEGESKRKAFLGGVLSGVVEPIGAVMTILVAQLVIPALPYLLSFAAGAMLYVVVEELIPEMSQGQHSNIGTLFFALGFSLMMILDVALG